MNRKEKFKTGLDDIHIFYDKIEETSTRVLNEIMPRLGVSFPDGETGEFNTVNISLGNKLFEGLTRLERISLENGRHKVKVNTFTIDWEEMPFFDKSKVLTWINDIIEAWKPAESEILRAKETLETGISEINGCLAKISDKSDKLLNEILPEPGDCCKIMDKPTDEDVISLYLDDFDHPEPIIKVYRSSEGDNFLVQTTARNLNWTDLPPLEKSFLVSHIKDLGNGHNDEI